MILRPGGESEARRIFDKWELDFAVIGRVTETGCLVLTMHGKTVAELPVVPLVSQAPLYDRPWVPTPKRPEVHWSTLLTRLDTMQMLDRLLRLRHGLHCPQHHPASGSHGRAPSGG